jgi:hypothetical protein
MSISSTKRRLNQLWKRRMNLEVKVNLLIKRRLGRFRKGALSSEDFEKATAQERNLDRVNEQIAKIEKRLRRPQKGFYHLPIPRKNLRHIYRIQPCVYVVARRYCFLNSVKRPIVFLRRISE